MARTPTQIADDILRMGRCLELAEKGAGAVSPNPLVGALLVGPDGQVLGEGWHGAFGGPHAEVWAIRDALRRHDNASLRSATLYVNLEPCSHYGKTPPCTDAILRHGIPRVVVGMADPNPAVSGSGLARLRAAGVDVAAGVRAQECFRLNEAFDHHVRTGRPLITLKVAQTLDGQVATATGHSRWISGLESRHLVHRWRAELDGVMIGSGTAAADDPALTVRHVKGRQPIRIVVDARGVLRPDLKLFVDAFAARTVAAVRQGVRPAYADALLARGGRLLEVAPSGPDRLDLLELLQRLGQPEGDQLPIQSILVEAGPGLATALFAHDLVDRYFLFVAPKITGAGTPSIGTLQIDHMADALSFADVRWSSVGADFLFKGYRRPVRLD